MEQKKRYLLQLEVDHKIELSYNSLEDINYFNGNILKKNDLFNIYFEKTHYYNA